MVENDAIMAKGLSDFVPTEFPTAKPVAKKKIFDANGRRQLCTNQKHLQKVGKLYVIPVFEAQKFNSNKTQFSVSEPGADSSHS